MLKTGHFIAAGLLALLSTRPVRAHDFWIEPERFRLSKGETVELSLRNGVEFEGAISTRDDFMIEKFVLMGPDGTQPVPGRDGQRVAGHISPGKDGLYQVVYRGKRRTLKMPAAKFEAYLKEEGLEHVSRLRAQRGETGRESFELYSRCAKTLLSVGAGANEGHDRVAGMRLEIIPETNPYRAAVGEPLTFRVLFEGRPLEQGLVVARSRLEPKHIVFSRTDAQGRVRLTLDRTGEWLVKCTHMVAAPEGLSMDWESLWASLTFELAAFQRPGAKAP